MQPTTESYEIIHGRKFWTHEKKFRAHEIPTRKYFGLAKYPQKNSFDPQNNNKKIVKQFKE